MSAETGSSQPGRGLPDRRRGSRSTAAADQAAAPAAKVTVMKPGSPDALEAQIQARREHLAATIDELTSRATPKAIARRTLEQIQAKIQAATHTPDGQLRTERLIAAGAAVLVAGAGLVWLRRRR